MYSSSLTAGPCDDMPDNAVAVATASIRRVYGNIIHVPIPMVAFMKRNNGEPYQVSSVKQPNTLF